MSFKEELRTELNRIREIVSRIEDADYRSGAYNIIKRVEIFCDEHADTEELIKDFKCPYMDKPIDETTGLWCRGPITPIEPFPECEDEDAMTVVIGAEP